MKKETVIVSAFPGVGKSWCFDNQDTLGLTILDSDSSNFSWLEKGVRHPDFPNNYMQHIAENMGKVDVICVSSDKEVRDALKLSNFTYAIVIPEIDLKNEYIEGFNKRGNNQNFINFIDTNWAVFLDDIVNEGHKYVVHLGENMYLCDFLIFFTK